jgi:hypothetical protein
MTESSTGGARPAVSIGWISAVPLDTAQQRLLEEVSAAVHARLERQFPGYRWERHRIERDVYPDVGPLDPLVLLELGAEEKLVRRLDYAIVFVPNELTPRNRIFVMGVPSSVLETAVFSSARLRGEPDAAARLTALALHLLGHLFGLDHAHGGVMRPTGEMADLAPADFPPQAVAEVDERLRAVADQRVEEATRRPGRFAFVWRTLRSDPLGILADMLDYAPWRMPLHLGRYTAATAVTVVFLFLSAEAWELGAHLSTAWLALGAAVVVVLAGLSLYVGQNFHQMGRVRGLREQLVRTRIVLFGALLVGIASLWASLFVISLVVMNAFPEVVFAGWSGQEDGALSLPRYAAFMATLGVVAGAFGGNLEEEAEIKAVFLFDEES